MSTFRCHVCFLRQCFLRFPEDISQGPNCHLHTLSKDELTSLKQKQKNFNFFLNFKILRIISPSSVPRGLEVFGGLSTPPLSVYYFKINNFGDTEKPELTTTSEYRPPAFWGPNFTFYNIKLLLNNDHLSTTTTNLGSRVEGGRCTQV